MKTIGIKSLMMVCIAALCMSGCTSTKAYFADRVQDAGDIFTATVGVGSGVAAKIPLFNIGMLKNKDIAGLRGGTLFHDPEKAEQYDALIKGGTNFSTSQNTVGRGKCIDETKVMGISQVQNDSCQNKANFFQTEVVAGIGPSVRLGFNPAEALDFTLGWFGIDIFRDDVNHKKLQSRL